jgi:hypothetical protein
LESTYKLYDHIDILPLDKFIDCICDRNYKALVIEGDPSELQILEAWEGIYFQYVDANRDNETMYILQVKKEVALLDQRLKVIECIVSILKLDISYHEKLIQNLKALGIRINGIDPSKDDYHRRLDNALLTLAPKKLQLQEKLKELKAYEASLDGKEVDRQFFKTMLIRLSKYMGGQLLRAKDIYVGEYVAILKDFLLHISSKKKSLDHGKER